MKRYLSNSFWLFLDKFIRLGVNFVLMGQTAKILGAEDFGLISYVQSIIGVIVCITSLGLDNILIKEFSTADHSRCNKLFNTSFFSRLFLSGLAIVILIIWLVLINESKEIKYVYAISGLTILFQIQTIYVSLYQGHSESYLLTKISLLSFAVSCGYKIYLILIQGSLIEFCLSFAIDAGINAISLFYYTHRNKIKLHIKYFDMDLFFHLLKGATPIIASALLISIYSRLDQWMIAKYLDLSDLGIYSVAIRVSEAASFVPIAVSTALIPYISNDSTNNKYQIYFSLVHFVSVITTIGVLVCSPYVIMLIFGDKFTDSITLLRYSMCSMTFSILGILSTNYLIQINKTYLRLIRIILGLAVNVILNTILIPRFGLVGASIAALSSQIMASWLGNCISKSTRLCFVWQTKAVLTFGIYPVLTRMTVSRKLNRYET